MDRASFSSIRYEAERLAAKREIAKTMTLKALRFAEADCVDSATREGTAPDMANRYHDEAAMYRAEIQRRK
jgi:hypothetical protein